MRWPICFIWISVIGTVKKIIFLKQNCAISRMRPKYGRQYWLKLKTNYCRIYHLTVATVQYIDLCTIFYIPHPYRNEQVHTNLWLHWIYLYNLWLELWIVNCKYQYLPYFFRTPVTYVDMMKIDFKYMGKILFHVNFFFKPQKWTKYGHIDRISSIYIKNHVVDEVRSERPNFVHHDFF